MSVKTTECFQINSGCQQFFSEASSTQDTQLSQYVQVCDQAGCSKDKNTVMDYVHTAVDTGELLLDIADAEDLVDGLFIAIDAADFLKDVLSLIFGSSRKMAIHIMNQTSLDIVITGDGDNDVYIDHGYEVSAPKVGSIPKMNNDGDASVGTYAFSNCSGALYGTMGAIKIRLVGSGNPQTAVGWIGSNDEQFSIGWEVPYSGDNHCLTHINEDGSFGLKDWYDKKVSKHGKSSDSSSSDKYKVTCALSTSKGDKATLLVTVTEI